MEREKERQRKMLEWRRNQIQLRIQYADTPAGFQDKETETAAAAQWEKDWKSWEEQQQYTLLSEFQPEKEAFAGRERELMQVSEAIERSNGDPVILYGIGGIGKSALARAWMSRHREDYRHILELKFCTNFCETVCSDEILTIANLSYTKEQYGSRRKYFKVKLSMLEKLIKDEKTLILIDGCDVAWDRDMEAVFSLPCKFIVTTRLSPVLLGYSNGILVEALESEREWMEFAAIYAGGDKEKLYQDLLEHRIRFRGHTSRILLELGGKPAERKVQEFAKSLLERLPLKQREKMALNCLSIMPEYRIPRKLFQAVTGCPDQILLRLQYFLLVSVDTDGQGEETLSLHPVAAEAAKIFLPPTSSGCGKMIRGFAEYLREMAWHCGKEENRYLEPYALALVRAFPRPAAYLAEAFSDLCRFLWLQEYQQEAGNYLFRIFESVKLSFGERHQFTGQIAVRIADLFYARKDEKNAEAWYQEGLEILRGSSPVNRNYYQSLSLAYCRLARGFRHKKRRKEAEACLKKARGYLEHYRVPPADINSFFLLQKVIAREEAWILAGKGQLEAAKEICAGCIEALDQRFGTIFCFWEFYEVMEEILLMEQE